MTIEGLKVKNVYQSRGETVAVAWLCTGKVSVEEKIMITAQIFHFLYIPLRRNSKCWKVANTAFIS